MATRWLLGGILACPYNRRQLGVPRPQTPSGFAQKTTPVGVPRNYDNPDPGLPMRLRTPNFPGNPKCRPCACPLCIRSFGTAQCELRAPSLKIGNPKVKPPERTGASQTASYKHWPFFLQPVTPAPLFVAPSGPRRRRASLLEHPQCGSRPLSGPWIDRNLYDGME